MNKKKIFLWALYDFANSLATVVFFLYFSQWLVIDNHVSDLSFNLMFVGASVLLLLTAPICGAIADKMHRQLPFIRFATVLQILCLASIAFLALYAQPSPTAAITGLVLNLLALYFYQFSLGFYNSLLHDIAPANRQGLVSGWGQFANWSGQVVGLLVTLPLASGAWHWFGNAGRGQPLLPAVVLFALFALPLLLLFKESKQRESVSYTIPGELHAYWANFKLTWALPGVGIFLLSFFFFNDAILTLSNNFPIYLEQVFGVADSTKAILLMGILMTSAVGGLLGGWIADHKGLKKTLLTILVMWTFLLPIMGAITNFHFYVVAAVVMGLLYGATWSVTRAVVVALVPPHRLSHAFSYYSLAERFSTFVGPVAWGLITTGLVSYGPMRYQIGAIALAVFIVIGLWLARKIPLSR